MVWFESQTNRKKFNINLMKNYLIVIMSFKNLNHSIIRQSSRTFQILFKRITYRKHILKLTWKTI